MFKFPEEFYWYLIFYIFVIFSVLIIISMINQYSSHDEPEEFKALDPMDLKTGDILGVAYNNPAGMFVSSFSRSIWSHTGVIWVDPKDGCKYVFEGAIYGTKYKNFMRIPFDTWYIYNWNSIVGIKKYKGEPIDACKMNDIFLKYEKNCSLEGFNPSWGRFLITQDYYRSRLNKSYTCFEVTILLLQELEVYKKEKIFCSYFPGHIMNGHIPLENENSYEKTFRFFVPHRLNQLFAYEKYLFKKKA